jgi:hypothetical protein
MSATEAMQSNPRGQKVERIEPEQRRQRAAADLAGARRSWARDASATRVARELGLGFDRE